MKIGILSDTHDHVWNLNAALTTLATEADVLIHCGDLCSPFIVPLLASGFAGPVHAVFGNNDADRYRLQLQAQRSGNVSLEGEFWIGHLSGTRVAVQHFDTLAKPLAESGRFDIVCCGHNHRLEVERIGTTWLVNPGTLLGYDPARGEDVDPTFVVLDTSGDEPAVWKVEKGGAVPVG